MKKGLFLTLSALLAAGCLSVCSFAEDSAAEEAGRLQIVTTIFPEYDWVVNILGDNPANADVEMLLDSGTDLHSFQPTAEDILTIAECDLFIYVGGESDGWVDDALQEATNKDMIVINLLDALGDSVKEEELVEGMQEGEHSHEHDEEHAEEHDEEHAEEHDEEHDEEHAEEHDEEHSHEHEEGETEYDEHVWLSLKNAAVLVRAISEALQEIDPENAASYQANADAYTGNLNALDEAYQTAVSEASRDVLLFGDRFPFRYLTDDYGLTYYAAFAGCSAESEASFETITFLAEKIDELSLPAVLTIEGNDHQIAEAIVRITQTKDQQILTMDSMQTTTAEDVENGETYLSMMENNLSVLKDALG